MKTVNMELKQEILNLKEEIERIESTFPAESAKHLIRDLEQKLDQLLMEYCPF